MVSRLPEAATGVVVDRLPGRMSAGDRWLA